MDQRPDTLSESDHPNSQSIETEATAPTQAPPQPPFNIPNHSSEHIIHSESGRRFVAHIYEQDPANNDENDEEGNVAKSLCLNLLSEFVKGSYQMIMYKENKGSDEVVSETRDSDDNAAENDVDYQSTESTENKRKCLKSLSEHGSLLNVGDPDPDLTPCNSKDSSCSTSGVGPPYKKAKYDWQIKNSGASNIDETHTGDSKTNLMTNNEIDKNVASETVEKKTEKTEVETPCDDSLPESTCENKPVDCDHLEVRENLPMECDSSVDKDQNQDTEKTREEVVSPTPSDTATDHPNSDDNEPNLTHLDRWQNWHVAKSVVDNAINKTLEDMGLTPGLNYSRTQRHNIEQAGVSQVIQDRGLRQPNNFLTHLTQVSENLFVQNMHNGLRISARIDLGDTNQAPPSLAFSDHLRHRWTGYSALNEDPGENSNENTGGANLSEDDDRDAAASISTCEPESEHDVEETPSAEACSTSKTPREESSTPSNSYVLDQALSAVINEKGLQF